MTELELRQVVVETAKKYLGYREEDGSHKEIIDIYNNHKPLKRGYRVKYTDAWCATFVSSVAILCGLTEIMPTECGCGNMILEYEKIGCWEEADDFVPQIGDILMYDWDDRGNGDNRGNPKHVGIVCQVSHELLKVIEGNKGNQVDYRKVPINGKYIRGYGVPAYGKAVKEMIDTRRDLVKGEKSQLNKKPLWQGIVTAGSLNVRIWAGVEYQPCSFSPLKRGSHLWVCDSIKGSNQTRWYYICYGEKYGFVHSDYVKSA